MTASKKQFSTIDDYIKTFPNDVQSILEKMRQTIKKAAPEAVETINYQMPIQTKWQEFSAFRSVQKSYWILSDTLWH